MVVILLRRTHREQTITETDYRSLCNVGIIFLCADYRHQHRNSAAQPLDGTRPHFLCDRLCEQGSMETHRIV
jgi:hypothetical protein